MTNKPKLVFLPGCFDDFEGTQEELDSLVEEITRKFESGELLEEAESLDEIEDDEIGISDIISEQSPTRTIH